MENEVLRYSMQYIGKSDFNAFLGREYYSKTTRKEQEPY